MLKIEVLHNPGDRRPIVSVKTNGQAPADGRYLLTVKTTDNPHEALKLARREANNRFRKTCNAGYLRQMAADGHEKSQNPHVRFVRGGSNYA